MSDVVDRAFWRKSRVHGVLFEPRVRRRDALLEGNAEMPAKPVNWKHRAICEALRQAWLDQMRVRCSRLPTSPSLRALQGEAVAMMSYSRTVAEWSLNQE
jgi:hypothetical protein